MKQKRGTVCVGLSGGVDSAVTAALLKKAGYQVIGVFIRAWRPDFVICDEANDRLDAMRVAAYLEIPFSTLDARATYRDEVVHYMIEEYRRGRTPNPDMLCNREVKFGIFNEFRKAQGIEYLATGHYAQIEHQDDTTILQRGTDSSKDQSYFLAQAPYEALTHTLFPLGDYTKREVRTMAKQLGLPNAQKKDSQGVCFLGQIDLSDFLRHYVPPHRGKVLNEEGETIGEHEGVCEYTIGQRHGFRITHTPARDVPHYVVEKRIAENILVVSPHHPRFAPGSSFMLSSINWLTASGKPEEGEYRIVTRYHGPARTALLSCKNGAWIVTPREEGEAVAYGQACVLYRDSQVLGSGIIEPYATTSSN